MSWLGDNSSGGIRWFTHSRLVLSGDTELEGWALYWYQAETIPYLVLLSLVQTGHTGLGLASGHHCRFLPTTILALNMGIRWIKDQRLPPTFFSMMKLSMGAPPSSGFFHSRSTWSCNQDGTMITGGWVPRYHECAMVPCAGYQGTSGLPHPSR